jgi:DNA-binding winged helix-turn-helix (wHTH) protein
MTTSQPLPSDVRLGATEAAVLGVLLQRVGKVTGRHDLNRLARLEGSDRRCDAALVPVRRALGDDAIVTIRRRGWMLRKEATAAARALLDSIS